MYFYWKGYDRREPNQLLLRIQHPGGPSNRMELAADFVGDAKIALWVKI